jgi:natural product precursor
MKSLKKLVLNKQKLVNLNTNDMRSIKGGTSFFDLDTEYVISVVSDPVYDKFMSRAFVPTPYGEACLQN